MGGFVLCPWFGQSCASERGSIAAIGEGRGGDGPALGMLWESLLRED